jgi:peptide/nickel transport system ATP-binding protein
VVEILASRIAVMYMGKIVEMGDRDQIVRHPQHEYTQRLVSAVPVPDPAEQRRRRQARDEIIARTGVS